MEDMSKIQKFFDGNDDHIREQIRQLKKIINELETLHRKGTIGSLSGGVIGAAGGITTIVGLALTPFTLGASLIVTGFGLGVAVAGGITGATSNIVKMVKKKSFQDKIRGILDDCENRLNPVMASLSRISSTANEFQSAIGAGRAVTTLTQFVKLTSFISLATQATKAASVVGRTIPVLTSVTLILDVISIAYDAKEINEIRKKYRGGKNIESEMLKFISELKLAADQLEQALEELKKVKEKIDEVNDVQ